MDDQPEDTPLAHLVHTALEPLREEVVRVSRDFARRVSEGIDELLYGDRRGPPILSLIGSTLLEAINLLTHGAGSGDYDPEEEA